MPQSLSGITPSITSRTSRCGFSAKKDVKGVLGTLATIGYKELKKNGVFPVPGFAKFVVIKKPATKARNLLARSSEHAQSKQQKTPCECRNVPSERFA
jgi:nucleoid DNA-binding protein